MGFRNKFMNKVDNYKSKHNEKSDLSDLDSQIKDENFKIDEYLMKLGRYYWDQYNMEDSTYEPEGEAKELIEGIAESTQIIIDLEAEKEKRAAMGEEERKKIDEETAQREAEEKQRKEEARMEREAQRAAKKAEKEAAQAETEEKGSEEEDDLF